MKTIVFDFDGTICDSYVSALECFNTFAQEHRYKIIPQEKFDSLRDLSSRELFEHLGINPEISPEIVKKVIEQLHTRIDILKPIPGIEKPIDELRRHGYKIGVLTSNSEKCVRRFALNYKITFDFVYSDGLLFGKHILFDKMLRDLGLPIDQVIYVGDETRDIEAAHKVGLKIIAVDWGFNSAKILKQYNPDWLIHSPEDLLNTLKV